MTVRIATEGPAYVSYSAFTSWLNCGKAYELSRYVKAPEVPACYLAGGSAVHAATEVYDRHLFTQEGR